MSKLEDTSVMPFGQHKGTQMANVPASYLMWVWGKNKEQYKEDQCNCTIYEIMEYIEDNLDVLQEEIKRESEKYKTTKYKNYNEQND
jgi:uncharacterized protein (DUF3820 family)